MQKKGALLLALLFFLLVSLDAARAQDAPAVTVTVDADADQHAISPNIYGVGMFYRNSDPTTAAAQITAVNAPTHRIGGNTTSTYNWNLNLSNPLLPQGDAWNLSADWYWESWSKPPRRADGMTASSTEPSTPPSTPSPW